ncbi:glycosyltransferase family 4 protein [Pacificibacter marinus]|uniref:D-inositol 3-phosphate glycosyltransferase n=1 Tax=Pacificibacter marinus TaxID=658057 RepID=A0A1Y5S2I3_9RHOB|nr:glycosyltransferase family 4 protein [Pacificibacter marinus]SEK92450.1 mannosyltransferase [Pacificibacter marinus]SLN31217.1 D-inositol 3-phosphate glycosyltransferase [Pacificibacter marinus]
MKQRLSDILVIAPNFKRRLSGVTATIVRLVPVQSKSIPIVATGAGLPAHVPYIPVWRLPFLKRKRRVWHARRNTEMLVGLVLKHIFRQPLKLLFTSASQRKHSGYTKWLIGQMDGIVATSAKTATYLERPCDVILHGIDLTDFTPIDTESRSALRHKLNLPDAKIIGCFGRIRAQKGTDLFIDAFIQMAKTDADLVAVVLGRALPKDQEFLAGLKTKIAQNNLSDRVVFPDEVPVDQIADWYRVLDLYVAPQRWEGFGLTPLEAMACGVPVVATDVGAFSEIISTKAGEIVPIGEVAPMVRAAQRLLSADQSGLSEAARAHVEAQFSLEREANALIDIYHRLLA